MQAYQSTVCVTKLEAARRQLESAITLYFQHGDPVACCFCCWSFTGMVMIWDLLRLSARRLEREFLGEDDDG